MAKKKETTPVNSAEPTLSKEKIAEAVTNNPALSEDEVKLGDRTFKLVYLPYDDYNDFLALLAPLFDKIFGSMTGKSRFELASDLVGSDGLSLAAIFQYCKSDLPELARICLKQTEPELTTTEIKQLAGSPFNLVQVVFKQLLKNKTVDEFTDFFGQIARILK